MAVQVAIAAARLVFMYTGSDTADHMYGSTSGKIMEAKLRKPAAAPDPVTGDRIDDQRDHGTI